MRVKQLIGPYAGQIIDLPYHVASACLAAGTACHPDEEPRIRGMKPKPDVEPQIDVEIPDDWETMHHMKRRQLAAKLTGAGVNNADDADEIIRKHLGVSDASPETGDQSGDPSEEDDAETNGESDDGDQDDQDAGDDAQGDDAGDGEDDADDQDGDETQEEETEQT